MSTNRYGGSCASCHTRVRAGQGFYDGNLWCEEPVQYEDPTGFRFSAVEMCPTAARLQEAADVNNAKRRAAQVAPEPTPEEVARREHYAARAAAWEAQGKRECGRCGGNGGSQAWPGYVCYGCEGRGYKEVSA